MQKPIVRWTIGSASPEGKDCLKLSVESFVALYGDRFDYFICHNNIDPQELAWSKNFPIQLFDQEHYRNELPVTPTDKNPCWKLYPPRLDLSRHEIMIDNDIVIYRHMPVLERFLIHHNYLFITEAIKRSYGRFEPLVKTPRNLNTGFMGFYPGFDLKAEIVQTISQMGIQWEEFLDEQAIIAMVFSKYLCEIVPLADMAICHQEFAYSKGNYGQHFVQLNQGFTGYYRKYLASRFLL